MNKLFLALLILSSAAYADKIGYSSSVGRPYQKLESEEIAVVDIDLEELDSEESNANAKKNSLDDIEFVERQSKLK